MQIWRAKQGICRYVCGRATGENKEMALDYILPVCLRYHGITVYWTANSKQTIEL
jgi:hypothetical protein